MKKNIILFLCLLIAITNSYAQPKYEQKIRKLMAAQEEAWNKGDLESFMLGYMQSDSLVFIGKSGVTYGWQNTLNNYRKGYPDTATMGKLKFRLIEIKKLSGKYCHIIGHWHLTRSKGDLQGHFTLLFRKIKGRWLIVKDHSS
jgi:ketosteroid isomerase-like protein